MAPPKTLTPLRRAVEHALTQATNKGRSLGKDGFPLFQLLPPAAAMARPAVVASKPGVLVSVKNASDPATPVGWEMSDRVALDVAIEVVFTFGSGNPESLSETRAALEVIERDTLRARNALCFPGALNTDPSGAETGLPAGTLTSTGWTTNGPEPWPLKKDDPRVLRVTHRYLASIELTQAAE
jgi:hypothetical protein